MAILASLPGMGRIVRATLLAEAGIALAVEITSRYKV